MEPAKSQKPSPAMQDYLKHIYMLELASETGGPAISTTALAESLGLSAASTTNMLKKLATLNFISYEPYRGAELTDAGRKVALEVLRHHRLLELYLAEALGVPWDQVHREAEILEHFLSEELEERIAASLGDPVTDPHGHPIPRPDLTMPEHRSHALWETPDGTSAQVVSVPDSKAEELRYLDEIGIRPGRKVEIVRRGPVSGPLFIRVNSKEQAISKELAEAVWVA